MSFDLSPVEYSRHDIRRGLRIPTEMTPDLAEFIGIMVGDGHVGCYKVKNPNNHYLHYEIIIAGNMAEKSYYTDHVSDLIFRVFGIKFNHRPMQYMHVFALRFGSKALFLFLNKVIGIPQRKDEISVPCAIMNGSADIKIAFFRGLADADFCLTLKFKPRPYPVLQGCFKSERLTKDCSIILKELGIENSTVRGAHYYAKRDKTYIGYRVNVNGKPRVKKYLELAGFSNPFKLTRYKQYF